MALEDLDEELLDDEDYYEDDDDSYGGSAKGKIIFWLIFLGLIVSFIFVLVSDVGGLREKYLRPTLEKIPVVKNLLPPVEEDISIGEFSNISKDELINLVNELNKNIAKLEDENKSLNQAMEEQNSEMVRLKELEASQIQFKKDKEEFDRLIALNDSTAYSKFYESISPENASKMYEESIKKNQLTKEFKSYAQTFESMKKDSAAKILEELMISDIDLVISILENISSKQRADILSAMSSENAASCTKRLAP